MFRLSRRTTPDQVGRMLKRLATYSGVDATVLGQEFNYLRPLADRFHSEGMTEPESWQKAVCEGGAVCSVLPRILVSTAAFGGSSSGVEQAFSLVNWALEGRRSWMSGTVLNNELKLLVDQRASEDTDVIKLAQAM